MFGKGLECKCLWVCQQALCEFIAWDNQFTVLAMSWLKFTCTREIDLRRFLLLSDLSIKMFTPTVCVSKKIIDISGLAQILWAFKKVWLKSFSNFESIFINFLNPCNVEHFIKSGLSCPPKHPPAMHHFTPTVVLHKNKSTKSTPIEKSRKVF